MDEYAGLRATHGFQDVLVGQLHDSSGTVKDESRVSVSIDGNIYYVSKSLHDHYVIVQQMYIFYLRSLSMIHLIGSCTS